MANVFKVTDPDDPRLEPYRMVRDRDLAGRPGLFMAEGEVVVRRLLSDRSLFVPDSALLAEGRETALAPALSTARPDLPVLVAPQAVMDRVAGFPIHRGVLAAGRRGPPREPAELLGRAGPLLLLVLVGLANHDNVGAAFRNAAAFGADAILLDGTCCDPLYRKAIRVSVGACLTVPFGRISSAGDLALSLLTAGIEPFCLSPSGHETLEAVRWPDRAAILVGTEGAGLPPDLLARARTVRVRMRDGVDSLNVATAAAVALHAVRTRPGD